MKDGGPAFPQGITCVASGQQQFPAGPQGGLTLRDYFAAEAMSKMMPWNTDYPTEEIAKKQRKDMARFVKMISETAYAIADAMLAEREKERP